MGIDGTLQLMYSCQEMGTLAQKHQKLLDQFPTVSDDKLRMSLIAMADKYDDQARDIIYRTYNDNKLALLYKGMRNMGQFEKGNKDKSMRQIVMYPNPYVYDFINTIMTSLKGPNWEQDIRNYRHELIRPWHVVSKL